MRIGIDARTLMKNRVGMGTYTHEVIKQLNFKNAEAIHTRAEDLAKNIKYRETFDACVSRAVAQLNTLAEYCLPFVKLGGSMIAYKSNEIEEELGQSKKAIDILGGKIMEVKTFTVADYERKIVEIKKINSTPKKYPRKSGLATKEPIK